MPPQVQMFFYDAAGNSVESASEAVNYRQIIHDKEGNPISENQGLVGDQGEDDGSEEKSDRPRGMPPSALDRLPYLRTSVEKPQYFELDQDLQKKEKARDYKEEYRRDHSSPTQIKERAQRNKARSKLGLKVGDPREADHKNPISNGGSNSDRNLRAVSRETNRKKGAKKE